MTRPMKVRDLIALHLAKERNAPMEFRPAAALWALRILVRLGGYKRFSRVVMDEAEVFEALGIEEPITDEPSHPDKLRQILKARLVEFEHKPPARLGLLGRNLRLLAKMLSLDPADRKILAFAVIIHNVNWLETAAETLNRLDNSGVIDAIATILGLPRNQVQRTFAPDSVLSAAGILQLHPGCMDLKAKLNLLDTFATTLTLPHRDTRELLKSFFSCPDAAKLNRADYQHARTEWSLVADYLGAVLTDRHAGINILIHGRSGTGKTQFVRALTAELGLGLSEVSTQDADGDALPAARRFGAYLLAQRVLAGSKRQALVFDEIEDVLPETRGFFGLWASNREAPSKARMNQVLEENPVPSFWLSNHIEQIDPAYLRRFDLVIEMPAPTRSVRRKMLQRFLDGIQVTEPWLNRMAEDANLMPAIIERAAKVVRSLNPANTDEAEQRFESVLRGSFEAMGHRMLPRAGGDDLIPYRLDYLNPDRDLAGLVEGLKWRGQGRLCLYGPPGTGKSAFGKHIAKELDRPLLIKRASDLLSMWVGGTEENIARMFREAEHEAAVLLLDEADSFLQDRAGAQRSWEITQVNELLTQMEAFNGIFIASTNLMDTLDSASLRRFDFKVRFDYLSARQRDAMFLDAIATLNVGEKVLGEETRHRLQALNTLVPGDFAVAARQSKLRKVPFSQEELLGVLAAECGIKDKGAPRPVGFTAPV